MTLSRHLKLLSSTFLGWVVFVIIGWPSYYQVWSFNNILYFCVIVYFLVGLAIYRMGNHCARKHRFIRSLWVAFYITIPFICYDYIYITFIRIEPFDLLNRFWFLSVFYIIPWIQAPLLYLFVNTEKLSGKIWVLLGITFCAISVFLKNQWAIFEGSFFDTMSYYPERNITLLESAIRYSIYGTTVSASILSFARFISSVFKK